MDLLRDAEIIVRPLRPCRSIARRSRPGSACSKRAETSPTGSLLSTAAGSGGTVFASFDRKAVELVAATGAETRLLAPE
jgi:hypothetical protein